MTSTSYLVEKKDGGLAHNRAGNGHALFPHTYILYIYALAIDQLEGGEFLLLVLVTSSRRRMAGSRGQWPRAAPAYQVIYVYTHLHQRAINERV